MKRLTRLLRGGWLGLLCATMGLAQTDTDFTITAICLLPGNQVELQWTGDTNRWYVVECNTNLVTGAGFLPCQAVPLFDGPFPVTLTVTDTPPAVASVFYRVRRTEPLGTCNHEQIAFGTPNADLIVQYGCAGNDLLYVEADHGDDRIEQYGGEGVDNMTAIGGNGADFVYQDGGGGDDTQYAQGGDGNKTIVQVGGEGNDTMGIVGGPGGGTIESYGGPGNDNMTVTGGTGDDTIKMDGGEEVDPMTYDLTSGGDLLTCDGGPGGDTLTINQRGQSNFTLKDEAGNILFLMGSGGSQITVSNVEHGQAIGDSGETLYEW